MNLQELYVQISQDVAAKQKLLEALAPFVAPPTSNGGSTLMALAEQVLRERGRMRLVDLCHAMSERKGATVRSTSVYPILAGHPKVFQRAKDGKTILWGVR